MEDVTPPQEESIQFERRRDTRDLKAEIELLREVARATNKLNERLVATLRWNVTATSITIVCFLFIAAIAMSRW